MKGSAAPPCCEQPWRLEKPRACPHVQEFKRLPANKAAFGHVLRFIRGLEAGLKGDRVAVPACAACRGAHAFDGGLHLCLHCDHTGCWKQRHIQQHLASSPGHVFAVNVTHAALYCSLVRAMALSSGWGECC